MKKLFTTLLLLTSFTAYSALPTVEGLFRNSNSAEVEGDYIVVKLLVESEEPAITEPELGTEQTPVKKYMKYIFTTEKEGKIQAIQVGYNDGRMSTKSIQDIKFVGDVIEQIKTDSFSERSIFYSLLVMFGMNNSDGITSVLTKYSDKFQSNSQMMNEDKIKLMDSYKKYLTAIKGDETLKEELISPMKPEEEEEKEKVKEIVKAGMYKRSNQLSLVRNGKKFFWKVDLETINAFFTNEEHRLSSLSVTTKQGTSVNTNFGKYTLFDGTHEIPEFMFITDSESKKYKVRVLSLKDFVNKGKNISERYTEYQKFLEENEKRKAKMAETEASSEVKMIGDEEKTEVVSKFFQY